MRGSVSGAGMGRIGGEGERLVWGEFKPLRKLILQSSVRLNSFKNKEKQKILD